MKILSEMLPSLVNVSTIFRKFALACLICGPGSTIEWFEYFQLNDYICKSSVILENVLKYIYMMKTIQVKKGIHKYSDQPRCYYLGERN